MTPEELLQVIADNFLVVRRLPFTVTSHWSYQEGDEERVKKPVYLEGGKILDCTREVIVQTFDMDWIKANPPSKWGEKDPEKRLAQLHKNFPNGRKLVKEVRNVTNGGWWFVKPFRETGSMVRFSREHDKFLAPTLEEAVQLYLNSKNGRDKE